MKKITRVILFLVFICITISLLSIVPYIILEIITWIQFMSKGDYNDVLLATRDLCFNIGITSFIMTVLLGFIYYVLDKKV